MFNKIYKYIFKNSILIILILKYMLNYRFYFAFSSIISEKKPENIFKSLRTFYIYLSDYY